MARRRGIQIGMLESSFQRTIAAHRSPGNSTILAPFPGAVGRLDVLEQVLYHVVFVLLPAVDVIGIKAVVPLGTDEQEFGHLLLYDHLFKLFLKAPVAVDGPARVIVVETVQEKNDGIL